MCKTASAGAAAAQAHFQAVARAIAKHNAIIRTRFPMSDPFYQKVEACFFGAFWDMPLQLLTFLDAVEKTCGINGEEHEAFALQLKQEIVAARRSAKNPARDARGEIKWERTLPFAVRALPDEIAAQARAFFASVYAVGGVDRGALHAHEKAFWSTHRRLVKVEKKAKRDKEDLYRVLLVLQRRLPDDLCGKVLLLAL